MPDPQPKRGRPPLKPKEVKQPFSIRATPAEKRQLATTAKKTGLTLTEWARKTLLAAASRDIP
jgi:predicted HicB family RNase H-like nuclease